MMFNLIIFKILYVILHGVCTVLEFFYNWIIHLKRKFESYYYTSTIEDEFKFIYLNVKTLDKIPTHVTVLLGTEEPSYKDLAKLVVWCMAAGISFISFYDYRGILKKTESTLKEILEKRKNAENHIIWHGSEVHHHKNGYTGRKVHLKVFSEFYGRSDIIETTKILTNNDSATKITTDVVDERIKEYYEFPDPDMGICCGKSFSITGYPPWQIRVTEFFNIRTHHNIVCNNFMQLLYRYNKCEQRFGK